MDLPRGPGERSPLPWREYIKNRLNLAIPWNDEDAIRAAASPTKTEEEQKAEAERGRRASDRARRKEEIAEMSPEDQERAKKKDYDERTREKKERWARDRSPTLDEIEESKGGDENG